MAKHDWSKKLKAGRLKFLVSGTHSHGLWTVAAITRIGDSGKKNGAGPSAVQSLLPQRIYALSRKDAVALAGREVAKHLGAQAELRSVKPPVASRAKPPRSVGRSS
ncbi:MAG: hypothetical protein ABI051_15185 [Vicinamibacterales bacterium]